MENVDPRTYLAGLASFGIKPGLERIKWLLGELGNPEKGFPSLHIAGTNGKGSTVALLSSMLIASGYKVGTYTSPHLTSFTERIRINGADISATEMSNILSSIRDLAERTPEKLGGPPTVFEVLTAAAFVYFARKKVDIAVVEVGMGGRWDATNVVDPLVSIITRIGYDHQDKLGNTIGEIAGEKAGIIKPGRPVVSCPQRADAAGVIANVASVDGSPAFIMADSQVKLKSLGLEGTRFDLITPSMRYENLKVGLLGKHQAQNAALAVSAIELLSVWYPDFQVEERDLREGLESAKWPGRLEVVGRDPLMIIDGAHNLDGVNALATSLSDIIGEQKAVFVLGMLDGKPVADMVRPLLRYAHGFICTQATDSRTPPMEPGKLAESIRAIAVENGFDLSFVESCDLREAVKKAKDMMASNRPVIITGSLYLIGELRGILKGVDNTE